MIAQYMGVALDLSKVKAVYMHDMKLVFEFDDMLKIVFNTETSAYETRSFPNSPIVQKFNAMDTLHDCFNAWVGMWREYQEINN